MRFPSIQRALPAAILMTAVGASSAAASTWQVCPDGTGDFLTIQAAVTAALPGDEIVLCTGTFTGPGNRDVSFLGKAITVRSQSGDPADCIIDCEGLGRGFLFVTDEDLDSVLEGVTIRNGTAGSGLGGGIRCGMPGFPPITQPHHGSPTIRNCVLSGNTAGSGGGMSCEEGSDPMVLNCRFEQNSVSGFLSDRLGGGVYCLESSPTFVDCLFIENSASAGFAGAGGGVYCESSTPEFHRGSPPDSSGTGCVFARNSATNGGGLYVNTALPVADDCTFYGNSAFTGGGAIYVYGSLTNPTFENLTLYGNSASVGAGVMASSFAHPTFRDTIIAMSPQGEAVATALSATVTIVCCDVYGNAGGPGAVAGQIGTGSNFATYPGFCDPSAEDFTVRDQSPCVSSNSPCGRRIGAWGMGCTGSLTYDVCPSGSADFSTIQAAIDACLGGDTIELCDGTFSGDGNRDLSYGGKPITIRSASDDPALTIIDCQGTAGTPRRAFHFDVGDGSQSVLRGVTVTGGYIAGVDSYGGAVWCDEGASPTITNCVFDGNFCENKGGAVACTDGAAPDLSGNTFTQNASGNSGGAVWLDEGYAVPITDCRFEENQGGYEGGAVYWSGSSAPSSIADCDFVGNTSAGHGGGLLVGWNAPLAITGCTFVQNDALDDGGGLFTTSSIEIVDCLFEQNTTIARGGGVAFLGDANGSLVRRCMFRENSAIQSVWAAGGGFSTYSTDIQVELSTFDGNSAVLQGGGVYAEFGSADFVSCTFHGNSAPIGGGVVMGGGSAERTIISFGGMGEAVVGTLAMTCCDVFGNAGGPGAAAAQIGQNGNIAADPIFCDAGMHDFTIRCDSPCRGYSAPNPECDLIGAWPVECEAPCGDTDGDQTVGVEDLVAVILGWGQCTPATPCPADVNCDGAVDVQDLTRVITTWGACP